MIDWEQELQGLEDIEGHIVTLESGADWESEVLRVAYENQSIKSLGGQ